VIAGQFHVVGTGSTPGVTETVSGTVRLELESATDLRETYHATDVSLTWTAAGSFMGCPVSGSASGTSQDPLAAVVTLFTDDDSYVAQGSLGAVVPGAMAQAHCPETTLPIGPSAGYFLYVLPGLGPPFHVENGRMQGTQTAAGFTFTWDLQLDPEEVELEVEIDGYADWLPRGGATEAVAGNDVAVVARLVTASGQPAEAGRFRFELVGTSREPGVAVNFPRPETAVATADLRLTQATDETARDPEGQWIEAGPGGQAAAMVSAYDFGAFGALRVTATLSGGREVVGYLRGDRATTQIPLPKRTGGSLVADAWKAANGVPGTADDADADALPVGDGHAGDGLTLYEEYRGAVQNGRHVRTDPRRKSLFVLNTIGGGVLDGLLLFKGISELDVHHQFTIGEIGPTRVVNTNHAQGPHRVDQHALWLRRLNGGFGETVGGPGTPGVIQHIDLADLGFDAAEPGEPADNARIRRAHVAHELFHGVNVWHHGENDDVDARWVAQVGPDGRPLRNADGTVRFRDRTGLEVHLLDEAGGPHVPTLVQLPDVGRPGVQVYVGYTHGEHSGDEACVMRYKTAPVSAAGPRDPARYWNATPQAIGQGICQAPGGTGANAPSHTPRPRYGDAGAGLTTGPAQRGRCAHQICVNDAHAHPH
jgi:hypothetical protein